MAVDHLWPDSHATSTAAQLVDAAAFVNRWPLGWRLVPTAALEDEPDSSHRQPTQCSARPQPQTFALNRF